MQSGGRGPVHGNDVAMSTTAHNQPALAHRIKANSPHGMNGSAASHGVNGVNEVNGVNGLKAAAPQPPTMRLAAAAADDKSTQIKNLTTTMSADTKTGLGSVAPSLSDMASSVEPIMDNFDSVLVSTSNKVYNII